MSLKAKTMATLLVVVVVYASLSFGLQRATVLRSFIELERAEAMRDYAPTIGAVFNLIGLHAMMHAGQFVPVRRMLGKPILI